MIQVNRTHIKDTSRIRDAESSNPSFDFFCHFVLLSLCFAVNYIKILLLCCVRCPVTPFGFAGHAEAPNGNPSTTASPPATRCRSGDTLAPTVRPGRVTRFWPITSEAERIPLLRSRPGDGCLWIHPPLSKINLRHRSPPRTRTGESIREDISPSKSSNDSTTAFLRQLP